MTPQADITSKTTPNLKTAASSPSKTSPAPSVQYKAANGKVITVAMAEQDNGNMGIFRECFAMVTMGIIMSWYYIVVILSLLCLVGICIFPAWRAVAATVFVLMWSAALLPLDYQVRGPRITAAAAAATAAAAAYLLYY